MRSPVSGGLPSSSLADKLLVPNYAKSFVMVKRHTNALESDHLGSSPRSAVSQTSQLHGNHGHRLPLSACCPMAPTTPTGARFWDSLGATPGCVGGGDPLTRFSSDSATAFSSANTTLLLFDLFLERRSLTSGRVLPGEMGSSCSALGVLGAASSRSKLKGKRHSVGNCSSGCLEAATQRPLGTQRNLPAH